MSGKGSRPRPFSVSQQEFADNYDKIFGKKSNSSDVDQNTKKQSTKKLSDSKLNTKP